MYKSMLCKNSYLCITGSKTLFTDVMLVECFLLPFITSEVVEVYLYRFMYRIAENVGGRKLWRIWRFAMNSPNFYPPIACNI